MVRPLPDGSSHPYRLLLSLERFGSGAVVQKKPGSHAAVTIKDRRSHVSHKKLAANRTLRCGAIGVRKLGVGGRARRRGSG